MGRKLFDGKDLKEVLTKLSEVWEVDGTDYEAAYIAGITPMALSRFLKNNPKIALLKEALKSMTYFNARKAIMRAIKAGDSDLALKYLERKKRKEFSLRTETEETGNTIKKIIFEDGNEPKKKERANVSKPRRTTNSNTSKKRVSKRTESTSN